jgi:hypothetical protein
MSINKLHLDNFHTWIVEDSLKPTVTIRYISVHRKGKAKILGIQIKSKKSKNKRTKSAKIVTREKINKLLSVKYNLI